MQIIDTHQHLWDQKRHSYSWCKSVPPLDRSFLLDEYQKAVASSPIPFSGSVHVEADVDEPFMEAETRWILSLIDSPDNSMQGAVIPCRPENGVDATRRYFDAFGRHPGIKGVRRVLHTQPDDLCMSETFIASVRVLSEYDYTFDLCALPRQLGAGLQLVRACPDTHFVLDHCGIPDVKGKGLHPWMEDISALAREPNVVACKISGLVAYADPGNWNADTLRPFVQHAIESFGWDRVVFGGDWPVCTLTTSLANWVTVLGHLIADAPASQQAKLWSENAKRVYRL